MPTSTNRIPVQLSFAAQTAPATALAPVPPPLVAVIVFAMAMAWVEASVVFYLRSMFDRLEPYQPNPLPFAGSLASAELVREAATMVMLATVGWMAGRHWRSRVAYGLLVFGVWDITYYLWLVPLTSWPNSLTDWDILFLLPLPWWGPVWAPMSIALLMIVFGVVVTRHRSANDTPWPGRISMFAAVLGAILALTAFMFDALRTVTEGGTGEQLRNMLPESFHYGLFLPGLLLLSLPVAEVVLRSAGRGRCAEGI